MPEKYCPTTTDELFEICVQLVAQAYSLHAKVAEQTQELQRVLAELRVARK